MKSKEFQYNLVLKTMQENHKFAKQLKLYMNNWTKPYHRNTEIRIGGVLIADSVLRLIWIIGEDVK